MSQQLTGWGDNLFSLYEDKLIIDDGVGIGVLNPVTGEILTETLAARGGICGGSASNGVFYISNRNATDPMFPDRFPLNAVEINTGKRLWGAPSRLSLGSKPFVHNGILYLTMGEGLAFYNAKTGEYLGISDQVHGDFWHMAINILYKDNILIIDGRDKLYAVKLDHYLDSEGNLRR